MKLFIWDDPMRIAYGGGVLIVAANTLEEARATLAKTIERPYGMAKLESLDMTMEFAKREPDVVRDLPCSEYWWWQ